MAEIIAVDLVIAVALAIHKAALTAHENQHQSKLIATRMQALMEVVKKLQQDKNKLKENNTRLAALLAVLREVQVLVDKWTIKKDSGRFTFARFKATAATLATASDGAKQFEDLNKRMTEIVNDMNFALTVEQQAVLLARVDSWQQAAAQDRNQYIEELGKLEESILRSEENVNKVGDMLAAKNDEMIALMQTMMLRVTLDAAAATPAASLSAAAAPADETPEAAAARQLLERLTLLMEVNNKSTSKDDTAAPFKIVLHVAEPAEVRTRGMQKGTARGMQKSTIQTVEPGMTCLLELEASEDCHCFLFDQSETEGLQLFMPTSDGQPGCNRLRGGVPRFFPTMKDDDFVMNIVLEDHQTKSDERFIVFVVDQHIPELTQPFASMGDFQKAATVNGTRSLRFAYTALTLRIERKKS